MPPEPRTKFLSCLELLALNGVTGKNSRFALQPPLAIRFVLRCKKKETWTKKAEVLLLIYPSLNSTRDTLTHFVQTECVLSLFR